MEEAAKVFGVMWAVMGPIIVIVFIGNYFKYKTLMAEKMGALKNEVQNNSTVELEKEIGALKERIAVLESIVTDRSFNLERKISSL